MSDLEETLAWHIYCAALPVPQREYRFAAEELGRQWRADFAWPSHRLLVECEGGTWARGRHTRGAGFKEDCEKYNAAALLGWRVLRFTSGMITSGEAVRVIAEALRAERDDNRNEVRTTSTTAPEVDYRLGEEDAIEAEWRGDAKTD